MDIHMLDGSTARPAKQVKAVQILRSQRADLEAKRLIQNQAFALSEKEEKRAKELERMFNKAQFDQSEHLKRLDEAPLANRSQLDELSATFQATAEFAEAEWQAQNEVSYHAHASSLLAERQVQALERVMVKNMEVEEHYNQQAQREMENRKTRADLINTSEVKAADTLENRHKQRIKSYERQLEETFALQESQEDNARKYHGEAIERMMGSTATTMRVMRDLKAKKEADHAHRKDTVLSLKSNSDHAFSKMKGANERRAKRQNKLAEAKAADFIALEKKGENPYKVFRTAQVNQKAEKTRMAALAKVAEKEAELVKRILVEDEYTRQKDAEARHAKEQEQKFRDELGRHVIEERNSQYLISRTTDKVDMVNPTGKGTRNFEPSQVTTIKDNSFGLGFNPRLDDEKHANVVKMVASKPIHKNIELGEFARFLPKIPAAFGGGEGEGGKNDAIMNENDHDNDGLSEFVENSNTLNSTLINEEETKEKKGKGGGNQILSKFELDCRRKAQERQKLSLIEGSPQIAAGRMFSGNAAFTPKPTKIDFLDFEIGKIYKKKVILTNVSLTFNSFKILDLPDNIRDFFEIKYLKPGRMSAGTTCMIEIVFKPHINEDLMTTLPLLTETGPCSIPIYCHTRKVVPSVISDHISFGDVTMGEIRTLKIMIKNSGFISSSYEILDPLTGLLIGNSVPISSSSSENDDQNHEKAESKKFDDMNATESLLDNNTEEGEEEEMNEDAVFQSEMAKTAARELAIQSKAEKAILKEAENVAASALSYPPGCGAIQFESTGVVGSYAETHHIITFSPLSPGYYHQNIHLKFSGCDTIIPIGISGTAELFPVYVKESVVDFRMIVYDKLYRKKLVLCNRGKIAFKVQAVVPPELTDFLEFGPDMGFVQPGVNFEIGIKLRPSVDLLQLCRHISIAGSSPRSFVVEGGSNIIAVPIHILVPKQAIPVFFTLKCQVTSGKVQLGSPDINFGSCYLTEKLIQKYELQNLSRLPQKFGFVNLPKELDVQPHDGFGVLLPLEKKKLDISFSPLSIMDYSNLLLEMKTSMGDTYKIPVSGIGIESPIELNHSVIELTPAAEGDCVTESVLVTNTNKTETLIFEWGIPYPELSGLVISPAVALIKPGQQVRVEVQFKPKVANDDGSHPHLHNYENQSHDSLGHEKEEEKAEEKEEDRGNSIENGARHGDETSAYQPATVDEIPESVGKITNSSDDEPWSVHAKWNLPCIVKNANSDVVMDIPPIYLDVKTVIVERVLELSASSLDFGELAVGQVKVIPLRVFNHHEESCAILTASGLNSIGPFSILSALRPIQPNSHATIMVQFSPEAQGVRQESLTLHATDIGCSLHVSLRGNGVSPNLTMDPPDGRIDLGHCLEMDSSESELTLHNASVFPLTFKLVPVGEPSLNFNNQSPFSLIPSEASVQPGADLKVKVRFLPDHERSWPYQQLIRVVVPNQVKEHYLHLRGQCEARQMYVAALDDDDGNDDATNSQKLTEEREDPLLMPANMISTASFGEKTVDKPCIKITFPRNQPHVEKQVIVGSLLISDNAAFPGSVGSFQLEWSDSNVYFSATEDHGKVSIGSTTSITFKFNPPKIKETYGLDVGQWARTIVKLKMDGGFSHAHAKDDPVSILLEGYIQI